MTEKNELAGYETEMLSTIQFAFPGMQERPFSQDIFLLKTNVAGCNHIPQIIEKLSALTIGQKLTLLREPENAYDKRAILVMNDDEKLGYLPRRLNGIFSRLMDAGKYLYATADAVVLDEEDEEYPWDALVVSIFLQD